MKLIPKDMFKTDRFFDDFWSPAPWQEGFMEEFFAPRVDIKDCKDHYEIFAELPGVKKDDIKISLVNGMLTLEAELMEGDKKEMEGKFLRQERRYGKLMRRFNLGDAVREEDIDAKFEDGLLMLTAPKRDIEHIAEEHMIAIH